MPVEQRLESLDQRHTALENALHEELNHPAFDDIRIHSLKRQKLRIKDQIAQLRSHYANKSS